MKGKRAILILCLVLLLCGSALGEAMSAMELAQEISRSVDCMDAIRAAENLDGCVDRALWTDNRTEGNCSLLRYDSEEEALNAAIGNATAFTMVRSAGAYNLYLGGALEAQQADEYEAALREALNLGEKEETSYILNVNTRRFHAPDCASLKNMKESNRFDYCGGRDAVVAQGYEPCRNCNP